MIYSIPQDSSVKICCNITHRCEMLNIKKYHTLLPNHIYNIFITYTYYSIILQYSIIHTCLVELVIYSDSCSTLSMIVRM